MTWLHEHHGEAMQEAFRETFLGNFDDETLARLGKLPEDLWSMLDMNGWELVLAEGELVLEVGAARCLDLIFEPSGPLLEASQRQYLEKLGRRPLSLYEVVESHPGVGLRLRDLIDDQLPVQQVSERSASESLQEGMVIGARLIPGSPWKLSGAVYSFPEYRVIGLLEELRREGIGEATSELARHRRSTILVDQWLHMLMMPAPEIVDASTSEPSLLVNDYYRVTDWSRLEASLAAQEDVTGDRRSGWSRLEEPEEEMSRTRLAINIKDEDQIEAFARTHNLADEGKTWLLDVAGDAIEWKIREIIDPTSLWDQRLDSPSEASSGPALDPSELPEGFHQQIYEQIYGDWSDQPIPALDNRTPREAIATPEGQRQVVTLLDSYERGEKNEAKTQKRPPADLGFMWDDLGLDRKSLSRS